VPQTFTFTWTTIMKRSYVQFLLALLIAAPAAAQEGMSLEVTAGSGYVMPSSPMTFSNYWNMEFGGVLGAGVHISPSVTLHGSLEYYRFALDEAGVTESFDTRYMRDIWAFNDVSLTPSGEAGTIIAASANVRVAPTGLTGVVTPYVTAGIGVMHFSLGEISLPATSVLSINGSDIAMTASQKITGGTETSPFFQGGIGLDLHVSAGMIVFIEARYAHGFSKGLGTSYVPVTAGIKFGL